MCYLCWPEIQTKKIMIYMLCNNLKITFTMRYLEVLPMKGRVQCLLAFDNSWGNYMGKQSYWLKRGSHYFFPNKFDRFFLRFAVAIHLAESNCRAGGVCWHSILNPCLANLSASSFPKTTMSSPLKIKELFWFLFGYSQEKKNLILLILSKA